MVVQWNFSVTDVLGTTQGLLMKEVFSFQMSVTEQFHCVFITHIYMYMYILTISLVLSVQYVTELELFGHYLVGI